MKTQVLDARLLAKFDAAKRHHETIWSDDHSKVSLLCMRPGQEVITHTHHGSHIWMVVEGKGELMAGKNSQTIAPGQIVVVPPFEDHGIRNNSGENLVIASITSLAD